MTQGHRGFAPPSSITRKKPAELSGGALALVIALGVVVVAVLVVLSGLLTLLAWNVGVVGIAAALGATVGKIGLGIAICANLAIGVISRIFRGPVQPVNANK